MLKIIQWLPELPHEEAAHEPVQDTSSELPPKTPGVPQDEITVGVPAYLDPADVTLPKVVAMPFQPQRPQRDSWRLPDGRRPLRALSP